MIIRFSTDEDMQGVCSLLLSEENAISDDLTPKLDFDNLSKGLSQHTIVVAIDEKTGLVCCMFLLVRLNSTMSEVHICIHKDYRGEKSIEICEMAKEFTFNNTPLIRVIAHSPTYNFGTYVLAKRMNMELIGVNKKSIVKNGMVYDQYIFGMSKENR